METGIPARLSPAEGRKFAFTVGIAFLVLGAFVWWRGFVRAPVVFGSLGGTLLVLGAVVPGRLSGLHRAWMGLALLISKVTTPIFMGVVYFGVVTPISALLRVAGKAPLRVAAGRTYWRDREPGKRRSNLLRQF